MSYSFRLLLLFAAAAMFAGWLGLRAENVELESRIARAPAPAGLQGGVR